MLLTTEKSLELLVVDWLYRPFVYPYKGHETITVVSGDTLEANIEVGLLSMYFFYLLILLRCIQQPCGNNVTGQLQKATDLTRPATVKVVFTMLYSPEASLLKA